MTRPDPVEPDFVVTVPLADTSEVQDTAVEPEGSDPSRRPLRPLGLFGIPDGWDPLGATPYTVIPSGGVAFDLGTLPPRDA